MRTQKRKQKEDREESGLFAAIPMEQLSGLDETLWLKQMAEKKNPNTKIKRNKKNSR